MKLLSGLVVMALVVMGLVVTPLPVDASAFTCDEVGLDAALAAGGGPHTFNCAGPTTVTTGGKKTVSTNVILDGGGNLTISGNDDHMVFKVDSGVSFEIRNLTIRDGNTLFSGGGIYNNGGTVTVVHSTITDNRTRMFDGGGIYNAGGGIVVVTDSTFSNNRAEDGAAIYNSGSSSSVMVTNSLIINNGARLNGGGIGNTDGTLTLIDSTISGNTAEYEGGGIYNYFAPPLATITNTTISGNSARYGGGIQNYKATMTVSHSTITGNTASYDGGGIRNVYGGLATVADTILAGNAAPTGPDCSAFVSTTYYSPVLSTGYNIVGSTADCTFIATGTDLLNVDPLLMSLADNGGPTQTHALQAASPALDLIPLAECTVSTDQRGVTRPQGTGCDAGAFELEESNQPPEADADVESQTVQYSDHIAEVTVTATDVPTDSLTISTSWSVDGGGSVAGLPGALSLVDDGCTVNSIRTCEWSLTGQITEPEGAYTVALTVTDDDGGATTAETVITVLPEDATVEFDSGNPIAVEVAASGGESGPFTLTVDITETEPDLASGMAAFGEIGNAVVSMSLAPVGPGTPSLGTCVAGAVTGSGYDAVLPVTCDFSGVPVNTYTVEVTVDGGYYDGYNEDVLVVYDTSLGFTTGGGWFYWPGTSDKTNFGYTMKYKKTSKVQGNFLLIRHMDDGSKYRVKSNALYGLAIGDAGEFSWASFSGKATYLEPGWPEAIGNHEFVVYVEDHGQPGDNDRVWLEMHDKDRDIIASLSMDRDATANATPIDGGNIVVPH